MATNPPSLSRALAGTAPPAQTAPPVPMPYQPPPVMVEPPSIQPSGRFEPQMPGRSLTKCEMGLCGPLGSIGVPGQQAAYITDGGKSVLTGPDVGGRSLLSALTGDAVLRRFGASPGALAQSTQQRGQYDLVQGQQSPEWSGIYQQALGQSGDPEWATAQANAGIGLANPSLTSSWALNSAPQDTARVNNARSRAAGAYALSSDPAALSNVEALGGFNPGYRVVGESPGGGLSVALGGGQVTNGVPLGPDLGALTMGSGIANQGIGAIVQQNQQRAVQDAQMRKIQVDNQLAQERARNSAERNTQTARRNDLAEERERNRAAAALQRQNAGNPLTAPATSINGNSFN